MKYVKTLGLAAVMAMALMAFAGATTASATVLCGVEPTEGSPATKGTVCPAGQAYGSGTQVHVVLKPGTIGRFTTTFKTIECEETTATGATSNEGSASETVQGTVEVLTLGKCNCEVKVLKKGTMEVHWNADSFNGTLTSSGAELTVICSTILGNIHCIYVTENTNNGTLTGGSPAFADVQEAEIPRLVTSGFCAEKAKWDATYEVTSPTPLYVAAHT
jgi:hypothetical protein